MNAIFGLLLFFIACTANSETYEYWTYYNPPSSSFILKKENNGLYLQFSGKAVISANIIITKYKDNLAVYLYPSKSLVETLPYSAREPKPFEIQLVNSDDLAKSLLKKTPIKLNSNGSYIVGSGTVQMHDFNIGGDCGVSSYFSFKYDLINFEPRKETEEISINGC